MSFSKGFKLASWAAASVLSASAAQAGGFINQSQSTVFNGMGYAGYAAPGTSPSAMFLNPATMTGFNRITTENNFSGVFPNTKINGTGATGGTKGSGDIGQDALVPASYVVIPWNSQLFFGLAFNAPYGLTTKPDLPWGGQLNSTTTKARTYTATPSVAYRFNDSLSIGFGIQAQYFSATFLADSSVSVPNNAVDNAGLKGDGWGYGITAGLTWTPMAGTAIGIGYRSRIDQKIEGNYVFTSGSPLASFNNSPIEGTLKLPDRLNLSIRQTMTPEWDILGSVEWHNWSRIGSAALSGPAVGTISSFAPSLGSIKFDYDDAWFFAVGSEYKWSRQLTLRGGVAYEISPVSTDVRTTRLPDNDRIWLSTGASYQVSERFTVNASYSHILVKDAPIKIASPAYVGESKAHVDILSLGLMTRW